MVSHDIRGVLTRMVPHDIRKVPFRRSRGEQAPLSGDQSVLVVEEEQEQGQELEQEREDLPLV